MEQKHLFNLYPARTAGMLSGARRVAMTFSRATSCSEEPMRASLFSRSIGALLLVTLLLTMTAQTAWAQDSWTSNECTVTLSGNTLTVSKTNPSNTGKMADYSRNPLRPGWDEKKDDIKNIVIEDGVTYIGNYSFCNLDAPYTNLESVTIPASVTSIGKGAFRQCTGLTSVTFEGTSQLTSVGDFVFTKCSSLTSITLPASLTSIGDDAFVDCNSLASINVDANNTAYASEDGVLFNKDKTTLILYPVAKSGMEYKIPDGVTSIVSGAFVNCTKLTSIKGGNDLTNIRRFAFNGTWYTNFVENLPDGLFYLGHVAIKMKGNGSSFSFNEGTTQIYDGAFSGSNITTIDIPSSVTSIGNYAFYQCTGLTSVIIPANVTSIGSYAFYECNLSSVYLLPSTPPTLSSEPTFFTNAPVYYHGNAYTTESSWTGDLTNQSPTIMFSLTSGVTTSGTPVVSKDGIDYYTAGSTITLSGGTNSIVTKDEDGSNVTASVLSGNTLTMPAYDITVGDLSSGDCGTGVTWAYNSGTKVLTISGSGAMKDIESGTPDWYDNRENIKSIVIVDGVTHIGEFAFRDCNNASLTTVVLPASVTSIGQKAFLDCSRLTSMTIPASVTSIGESIFFGCSNLETITVATGNLNYDSHGNCNAIIETTSKILIQGCKNTTIPDGVETIAKSAFNKITGLTSVTIPASVTSIGEYAFRNCTGLTSVTFASGSQLATIGDYAFGYSGLTSVTIPANVTSIGKNAFRNCAGLTSVTFASGSQLATIDNYAFYGCNNENFTSITIPASVTSIGQKAFENCTGLSSVVVNATSAPTLGSNAFNNNKSGRKIYVPADYIGNYTTNWPNFQSDIIGYNGTCGATGHESDVIWVYDESTKKLTIAGTGAMKDYNWGDPGWDGNSSNIKSIVIEDGVTHIGEFAFRGCNNASLTTVVLPASVTSIGQKAFENCAGLTSMTIPASMTSIGESIFFGCSNLETITVATGNSIFDSHGNCNAIIETTSKILIQGCKNTTIPDGVETIAQHAFNKITGLTSITIPASVTTIGDYAFRECTGLTSVTFASGSQLATIGESAFENCTGLTSIEIPDYVTSIGQQAFLYCTGLTSVTFASGSQLASIGDYAFYYCTNENFTSMTIPASVTSIGNYVFGSCDGLTSVTVYAPTCTLGSGAFGDCDNLANIYVPAGSMETYKNMTNWSAYETKLVGMLSETEGITSAIATDIAGKPAQFSRTFTSGVASTICLPFPMTSITGGTAYEFTAMEEVENVWTATMSAVTSTEAGKPYLFKASAGAVSFSGTVPSDFTGVAASSEPVAYSGGGTWTFCGTYTMLTYGTNLDGAVYGFAGATYDGVGYSVSPGDFVKAETGAFVSPFRCYLTYNAPSSARGMTRGADIELPSRIIVRLVGSNGQTTAIGSMDTKTGEVTFDSDAWYSLDGRKLNGKPTKKGMYINNGRKMIIK